MESRQACSEARSDRAREDGEDGRAIGGQGRDRGVERKEVMPREREREREERQRESDREREREQGERRLRGGGLTTRRVRCCLPAKKPHNVCARRLYARGIPIARDRRDKGPAGGGGGGHGKVAAQCGDSSLGRGRGETYGSRPPPSPPRPPRRTSLPPPPRSHPAPGPPAARRPPADPPAPPHVSLETVDRGRGESRRALPTGGGGGNCGGACGPAGWDRKRNYGRGPVPDPVVALGR